MSENKNQKIIQTSDNFWLSTTHPPSSLVVSSCIQSDAYSVGLGWASTSPMTSGVTGNDSYTRVTSWAITDLPSQWLAHTHWNWNLTAKELRSHTSYMVGPLTASQNPISTFSSATAHIVNLSSWFSAWRLIGSDQMTTTGILPAISSASFIPQTPSYTTTIIQRPPDKTAALENWIARIERKVDDIAQTQRSVAQQSLLLSVKSKKPSKRTLYPYFNLETGDFYINRKSFTVVNPWTQSYYFFKLLYEHVNEWMSHEAIVSYLREQRKTISSKTSNDAERSSFCSDLKAKLPNDARKVIGSCKQHYRLCIPNGKPK